MATNNLTTVQFLYKRVIEETIRASRETFVNEGIEDSVLQELKQLWEKKLENTNAIEPSNPPDYIASSRAYGYGYGNRAQPSVMSSNSTTAPRVVQYQSPFLTQSQDTTNTGVSHGPGSHVPMLQGGTRSLAQGAAASTTPQFPAQFPSVSGVTTITKKVFNQASNSIQVDGNTEVPERCTKHKKKRRNPKQPIVRQLDGADSDDDVGEFIDSDDSDDDDESDEEIDVEEKSGIMIHGVPDDIEQPTDPDEVKEEDEPLCSDDDDSDDVEGADIEQTDNVVVCLAEKITRSKNKWKLQLREGVMSIGGKDHVFQKAIGEGEW